MERKQVFISYRSTEREAAMFTRDVLEENGISCWIDSGEDGIDTGENYAAKIDKAIEDSHMMVLILSAEAQGSEHVKNEFDRALKMSKPVMAFIIEECDVTGEFDSNLPYANRYIAYENRMQALEKMVSAIKLLLVDVDKPPHFWEEIFRLAKESAHKERLEKQEQRRTRKERKERDRKLRAEQKKILQKKAREDYLEKGFPFRFTPYSKPYAKEPYVRLSLNVYTGVIFAVLLIVIIAAIIVVLRTMLIFAAIPFLVLWLVLFLLGEAVAGLFCRLVGRIKNRFLVVMVSLLTSAVIVVVLGTVVQAVVQLCAVAFSLILERLILR